MDGPTFIAALLESLQSRGIQFGLSAEALTRIMQDYRCHDLRQTERIAGTSSAGVFEALLQDERVTDDDLPGTLRKGTVTGRLEGFMGITFPAEGRFSLIRHSEYDTLAFQLVNTATAKLDAQITRLHANQEQCFFSFSVKPGLLGKVFGVPNLDTAYQVPIQIESTGVAHFGFQDDDVPTLVSNTAGVLEEPSLLNQDELRETLELAAPLSLYAYEHLPKLFPAKDALAFPIPLFLEEAYEQLGSYKLPEISLSFGREPGEETCQTLQVIAVSEQSLYFTITSMSEREKKALLARYQTLQVVADAVPIFCMSLHEIQKNLLPNND